jgi:1,4-dihydroxy-2-naphthoate octaprenyltransferase
MTALAAFVRLSRLKFLTGGFLGVALGVAIARRSGQVVDWHVVTLVQLAVTSLQLMTHYSNDYFDQESDALAVRTAFSGGSGVLASGALAPGVALNAALFALFVALCACAALAGLGRWYAVSIAAAIAVLAWAYSAPPFRLHSRGAGEVATALVVGMLVPLLAFSAQANGVTQLAVLSALPASCAMFVMMLCVEIPDAAADRATGKRNLLVRFGIASAPTLIAFATTAIVLCVFLAMHAGAPRPFVAVAVVAVLLTTWLRGRLNRLPQPPHSWTSAMGVAIFVATLGTSVGTYVL